MKYFHVIDEAAKDRLLAEGFQLLKQTTDIKGFSVYTFQVDKACFDIDYPEFQHSGFFSDRLTLEL